MHNYLRGLGFFACRFAPLPLLFNARSLLNKMHARRLLDHENIHYFILTTRTCLSFNTPDIDVTLAGYRTFRKDRQMHRRGGDPACVRDTFPSLMSKYPKLDKFLHPLWLILPVDRQKIPPPFIYRMPLSKQSDVLPMTDGLNCTATLPASSW